jgi:hypothetical protein
LAEGRGDHAENREVMPATTLSRAMKSKRLAMLIAGKRRSKLIDEFGVRSLCRRCHAFRAHRHPDIGCREGQPARLLVALSP